jgi:hypothetical protein
MPKFYTVAVLSVLISLFFYKVTDEDGFPWPIPPIPPIEIEINLNREGRRKNAELDRKDQDNC